MTEARKRIQHEDSSNVTGNSILRNHSWSQAFDSEEGDDGNENGLLHADSRSVFIILREIFRFNDYILLLFLFSFSFSFSLSLCIYLFLSFLLLHRYVYLFFFSIITVIVHCSYLSKIRRPFDFNPLSEINI